MSHPINNAIIDDAVEAIETQGYPCPECGASTFGTDKRYCSRCDWSGQVDLLNYKPCNHVYDIRVVTNDEINGREYVEVCIKCGTERV